MRICQDQIDPLNASCIHSLHPRNLIPSIWAGFMSYTFLRPYDAICSPLSLRSNSSKPKKNDANGSPYVGSELASRFYFIF